MRDHYDFANMQGRRNPFIKQLKQPVTMELDRETLAYFEFGLPARAAAAP